MTPEIKLKTELYNYWNWFKSQYEDRDELPEGVYVGPDGNKYTQREIVRDFLEDLRNKVEDFLVEELPFEKEDYPIVKIKRIVL